MSLESYNGNLSDLVITNPTPTDPKSQGDDHLRGIKKTLVDTFGATTGPIYGPSGVKFPDGSVQGSAAYSKAESNGPAFVASSISGPLAPGNNVLVNLTETADTNNCFANNKFTPNVAGYYQINMYCEVSASGAGATIRKNGANLAVAIAAVPEAPVHQTVSAMSYMNGTTDYFDFVVYSVSSANLVSATMQGFLARRA